MDAAYVWLAATSLLMGIGAMQCHVEEQARRESDKRRAERARRRNERDNQEWRTP